MNWKQWSVWGAVGAGLALLATKFFDVLAALLGPELALKIVDFIFNVIIILGIAVASIIVSWVVTEVFKRIRWENPDEWRENKGRLWLCSITWNFVVNGGALVVRYQPFEMTRNALEIAFFIGIWTTVVCGIGIAAYDVFVNRLWHRLLRHFFPTKLVRTPKGVVERDADVPSDPQSEKTIVIDRNEAQ